MKPFIFTSESVTKGLPLAVSEKDCKLYRSDTISGEDAIRLVKESFVFMKKQQDCPLLL